MAFDEISAFVLPLKLLVFIAVLPIGFNSYIFVTVLLAIYIVVLDP
jgi:hypothetical protein